MRSLKTKIIAVILLCSIAAVALCGGLSIQEVAEATNKDSEQIMMDGAESAQLEVNDALKMMTQSVNALASIALERLEEFERFKQDSSYVEYFTKGVEPLAKQLASHTDGALTCYIRYNPEFTEPTSGIFLTRDNTESQFNSVTPTDFSQYDSSDVEHVGWYYIPVQNGEPTWMDPYLNENINVYMISYVVPLFIDGESVGIVGMDIDFSLIQNQMKEIKLFDSGYAFLASSSDKILYHPDLEIGTALSELKDSGMKDLVKYMNDADSAKKVGFYDYQGKSRSAICKKLDNGMKLVLTAPTSELQEVTTNVVRKIIMAAAIAIALAFIVGIIISIYITRPLKKITDIVAVTADLNFAEDGRMKNLCKLHDEIGGIARAVKQMQEKLRAMVQEIQELNQSMDDSAQKLGETTAGVQGMCDDNSATTQELAASMEETAASTEGIYHNVEQVNENAGSIATLSGSGADLSKDVHQRAINLQEVTKESTAKTQAMYEDVRQRTDEAIKQAKAVEKIREMTDAITKISSQTNLLALNASIEAARAGEAGKGFAVVATEIGGLASQTLETVNSIEDIVKTVIQSVGNMSDCLISSTDFLEKTVLADYGEFNKVSQQYTEDALAFMESMGQIQQSVIELSTAMENVTEAVSGINATVNEAATGISDISAKTSDMASEMVEARDNVEHNEENIKRFDEIVAQFKL